MTIAWYWHLKHMAMPLLLAILISWSIALFEYCFQVPANRYGYADPNEQLVRVENVQTSWPERWWRAKFSAPQLKIIQEVITISVFVLFNFLYLKNTIRLTDWAGFALIILAVVVMMYPRWTEIKAKQQAAWDAQQNRLAQIDQGASSSRPGDSR
jgi:hypothetical protein